jgi:hypothetical protein
MHYFALCKRNGKISDMNFNKELALSNFIHSYRMGIVSLVGILQRYIATTATMTDDCQVGKYLDGSGL